MPEVTVRDYKEVALEDGVLFVSVPHAGIGNTLFSDFLLETLEMDQVAALDSESFPPLAMMWHGKARYPLRMHADPRTRVAVLRSEFSPHPAFARALARAILGWARRKKLARIVVLDALVDTDGTGAKDPPIISAASTAASREAALKAGCKEFDQGVLMGLSAALLLEARFAEVDVLALIAEVRDAPEDARSALSFARLAPALAPIGPLDVTKLARTVRDLETTVRTIRAQAEKALEKLRAPEAVTAEPPMYG